MAGYSPLGFSGREQMVLRVPSIMASGPGPEAAPDHHTDATFARSYSYC